MPAVAKQQPPRPIDEINKDFAETTQRHSQAHYQIFLLEEVVAELEQKLKLINQEGAARQDLDKKEESNEQA